jgi:hypothetical protein
MNADPAKDDEPSVVGMRVRPKLALALYALLVVSAATALWTQNNAGVAPVWVERGAPWVFLAFVIGFGAYRLALVSAGRYSAFKAFFQIFVAVLFFLLLLLPGSPFVKVPSNAAPLASLLRDPDPKVRALAAEVAGYRRDATAAPLLVILLSDSDPAVATQAHAALVRLNDGGDLGTEPAPWKERFK